MNERTSYDVIINYLPAYAARAMRMVKTEQRERLSEVRIRSGRALSFVYPDKIKFLTFNGSLTNDHEDKNCVVTSHNDISNIVASLSHYSLHCCKTQLSEGFFTIENGIRVGVAGSFSSDPGEPVLKYFNGLNFRMSRCIVGCGYEIFKRFITEKKSILICGGVNSGKTTILRDVCRSCGDRFKTALIDERNEISSLQNGQPMNDVGAMTDIISGCKRSTGIELAVRTLSPDYIMCDEISSEADSEAIIKGIACGAAVAATIHAPDMTSLLNRNAAQILIHSGMLDQCIFLSGADSPGKIKEIRSVKNVD